VPSFTHKEAPHGGVTIETDDVVVEYTPVRTPSAVARCFPLRSVVVSTHTHEEHLIAHCLIHHPHYLRFPRIALLPPVRSLDGITGGVPLNCTDAGSDGESTGNYDCSYAPISREGWAVYNDAEK